MAVIYMYIVKNCTRFLLDNRQNEVLLSRNKLLPFLALAVVHLLVNIFCSFSGSSVQMLMLEEEASRYAGK